MTTMTTTTTRTHEIKVHLGGDVGPTIVDIGDQSYYACHLVSTVRLEKFETQGGEIYTLQVGARGCYGCTCPDARYRRRECKHVAAANRFLDEVF